MKRTLIRSTVMILAVLAVSVGVKAQSAQQYSANIPFDFEARGERHAAGKYRLGSISVNSPGSIGLREMRSGELRVIGLTSDMGSNKWDRPGTMTFLKVNGRYLLSEVSTATFKLRVKRPKADIRAESDVAQLEKVVTIYLN